ncbi:MAG: response regulator [Sphingomonadales bacterium]
MSDKRLLVVDDEPDIGDFIRAVAEGQSFEVVVTSKAGDFLKAYDEFNPTAICLDVVMPDVDGIELLKLLADRQCEVPILVISGYSKLYLDSAENLAEAFGLPYVKTLAKPLGLSTLRAALREVA